MFLPYLIIYLFVFTVGLCVGSFLNVLAYRIPNRLDFVRGRSFCPNCKHSLAARDLVPLFSWLCLRGKCRYCGARISPRYCVVELLTGVLAILSGLAFHDTWAAPTAFLACCILLTVSLIDMDTQEIPDGLVIAFAIIAIASVWTMPDQTVVSRLIGMVCVSVPMLLINLFIPTSFGGGDVKLMAAGGFLLGWKLVLLSMFLALLSGGGYGIFLLARKRAGRRDHFAFGPFLAAGMAVALFVGDAVVQWYAGLFL